MFAEELDYNETKRRYPEAIAALEAPHPDGFIWSIELEDEDHRFLVIANVLHTVHVLDMLADAWIDGAWGEADLSEKDWERLT